ncbi:MAG: phage tail protein [Peptococcaceae bacterium]|jgi:phage-related tail fiber protein|nr:phage tail protein [Peptococcaceae bacterium]
MSYYIVTTTNARNKLARARKGEIPIPTITNMVFGTGGHNPGDTNTPVPPTPDDTALETQVLSKAVTQTIINQTTLRHMAEILDSDNLNGTIITEAGLIDNDGDLVVRATFSGKLKEAGFNLRHEIDELF